MEAKWTLENKFGFQYNMGERQARYKEKDGVAYFTFPDYEKMDWLKHGFSTRLGGVSKGEWATMNLSYTRGDDPDCVDENYRRICKALDIEPEHLVLSDQVHDVKVYEVGKKDCQGEDLREKKLVGIDGMVTKEAEVALCTTYADCVPLFIVDQKKKVIGHSHSGWRGTVGKMGACTIDKMKDAFGSEPEDLQVVIGPSICQFCYEVSKDVWQAFENFVDAEKIASLQNMDVKEVEQLISMVFEEKKDEKYQLDLWLANLLIFMEAGVPREQIAVSCVCTCCNHELLFSHRKTNGKRGNLCGFMEIK